MIFNFFNRNIYYTESYENAYQLYHAIRKQLQKKKKVTISFKGMKDVNINYLKASIERLYDGEFTIDFLNKYVKIIDIPEPIKNKLSHILLERTYVFL